MTRQDIRAHNEVLAEAYTTWGNKLLQHTDVLRAIQHEKVFRPIQVQLGPCEVCDSDCPFCSVGYRPYKSYMPFPLIRQCLQDFRSLGAKSVEITGGGNPLLYRDAAHGKNVNDIIRLATGLGLEVGIVTNSHDLGRLDPTLFPWIQWIRVSLIKLDEGVGPEHYDFRGFPAEKLGLSYIVYAPTDRSPRRQRASSGTTEESLRRIARLVEMNPEIKFVRIAGDARLPKLNCEASRHFDRLLGLSGSDPKYFMKEIGDGEDQPFAQGCYVGALRPYVAASPDGDGHYYVYICGSHMLFSGQTYDKRYALCPVEEILPTWKAMSERYSREGYPYEVDGNRGRGWDQTCLLCYFRPNNKLLHAVAQEMPDKNFP